MQDPRERERQRQLDEERQDERRNERRPRGEVKTTPLEHRRNPDLGQAGPRGRIAQAGRQSGRDGPVGLHFKDNSVAPRRRQGKRGRGPGEAQRRKAQTGRANRVRSGRAEALGARRTRDVLQDVRPVGRALGRLQELLDHPVALELRDVVDEQDPVEMVDLVLGARSQEAPRRATSRALPSRSRGADAHGVAGRSTSA